MNHLSNSLHVEGPSKRLFDSGRGASFSKCGQLLSMLDLSCTAMLCSTLDSIPTLPDLPNVHNRSHLLSSLLQEPALRTSSTHPAQYRSRSFPSHARTRLLLRSCTGLKSAISCQVHARPARNIYSRRRYVVLPSHTPRCLPCRGCSTFSKRRSLPGALLCR